MSSTTDDMDRPVEVPRTSPSQWAALNAASLEYDAMIHARRESERQARRFAAVLSDLRRGGQ